ncbi:MULTISPECIES: hypothetical protein [Sphingomonas]|nr:MULTISPECIES: hypothetical protein [Sphingomonas]MDK8185037.1 hypothetical protein [Sphingomonas zeae]
MKAPIFSDYSIFLAVCVGQPESANGFELGHKICVLAAAEQ